MFPVKRYGITIKAQKKGALLFTPRLITPLISREDARNGSEPGRPSPKAIWNGGLGYCLLGTSEQ